MVKKPWALFTHKGLYPPTIRLNYTVNYLDEMKVLKKKKNKPVLKKNSKTEYLRKQHKRVKFKSS